MRQPKTVISNTVTASTGSYNTAVVIKKKNFSPLLAKSHMPEGIRGNMPSSARAALLLTYKDQLNTHKSTKSSISQRLLHPRKRIAHRATYAAVTANNSTREALLQSDIKTAQASENAQTIPTRLFVSVTALRLTIEAQGRRMIMMELSVLLSMV